MIRRGVFAGTLTCEEWSRLERGSPHIAGSKGSQSEGRLYSARRKEAVAASASCDPLPTHESHGEAGLRELSHEGMHHVGIPVSDLGRSLAFYKDILKLEPAFVSEGRDPSSLRPSEFPTPTSPSRSSRSGNTVLELLEYRAPRGRAHDRMNCDVGAIHVAFEVADQEAYDRLRQKGIVLNAPPLEDRGRPSVWWRLCLFQGSGRRQLEIFETTNA